LEYELILEKRWALIRESSEESSNSDKQSRKKFPEEKTELIEFPLFRRKTT